MLKKLTPFLIVGFFVLWMAPVSINTRLPTPTGEILFYQSVVLSLLLCVSLLSVAKRLFWPFLLAIPLIGLWWPAEMFMRVQYEQPLGPNAIALLFETNRQELLEQIRANWISILTGVVLSSGFLFFGAVSLYKNDARWNGYSRYLSFGVSIFLLALILCQDIGALRAEENFQVERSKDLGDLGFVDVIRDVYPLNVIVSIMDIWEHRRIAAQAQKSMQNFDFEATAQARSAEIVILVIGESSKAKRWQLYGAKRETTPLLLREKNLIVLNDMIVPAVATRLSVPTIVSRNPFIKPTGQHISSGAEPSVAKAFEQAGYSTYWWSNQAITGIYDTSTAIYARHSQQTLWLNPVSTDISNPGKSTYDAVLLPPLDRLLKEVGKKFIVMHTMGSHFDYGDRYPPEFNYFNSSVRFNGINAYGSGNKVDFQNAYDNSIRYTDWLLHQIFERLRHMSESAIVFYISDHGEDIWDESCFQVKIDRRSAASFHVPALIWFNDAAISSFIDIYRNIRGNSNYPLTSDYIPQSIMSAAGIMVGAPSKKDVTHDGISVGERMVSGFGGRLVDYDKRKVHNYCDIE